MCICNKVHEDNDDAAAAGGRGRLLINENTVEVEQKMDGLSALSLIPKVLKHPRCRTIMQITLLKIAKSGIWKHCTLQSIISLVLQFNTNYGFLLYESSSLEADICIIANAKFPKVWISSLTRSCRLTFYHLRNHNPARLQLTNGARARRI